MAKKQGRTAQTSAKQQQAPESIRLGFFGASGSGKTYRAKQLCKGLKRLIVFDPTPEVDWAAECNDGVFYPDEAREYIRNHFDSGFRVCIVPSFGNEAKELNGLCMFLIDLQKHYKTHGAKITLVNDEMDLSFATGTMQKNPRNMFGYLCRRGRHLGINLLGLSQRINQVDITFRANLSGCYFFQHTELADIEQCKKLLPKQYHAKFSQLKAFDYIYKAGALAKVVEV